MLIINFLKDFFKLYYCDAIISLDSLKINGSVYLKDENSKESGGFIGFFDWLRLSESEIVGVRICYLEDQPYNQILHHLPYVASVFDSKCFELLFKGNSYNYDISGDQDFTNNYVYESRDADYLFTFGLDHLTVQETNSLVKYCEILSERDLIGSR